MTGQLEESSKPRTREAQSTDDSASDGVLLRFHASGNGLPVRLCSTWPLHQD